MAARITTEKLSPIIHLNTEPSEEKIIGCAITIILAIGGLVTAGIGAGGYLQVGSLSQLSQMQSIIMMAAGGEGGALLLIVGITSAVKMCQQRGCRIENEKPIIGENKTPVLKLRARKEITSAFGLCETKPNRSECSSHPREKHHSQIGKGEEEDRLSQVVASPNTEVISLRPLKAFRADTDGIHAPLSIARTAFIPSIVKGKVYGAEAEAWKIWTVEVADIVPKSQEVDWDAYDPYFGESYRENYALLYIPEEVRVNGTVKAFDIEILEEISGNPKGGFSEKIKPLLKNCCGGRWVLVSTKVIPDSLAKNYSQFFQYPDPKKTQSMLIGDTGFRMAHALEAALLCLMVRASTGEELFGRLTNPPRCLKDPQIHTRCIETFEAYQTGDWRKPAVVGFESNTLRVTSTRETGYLTEGVIAVREIKSLYQIS